MGKVQTVQKLLGYMVKPNKSILINNEMKSFNNFSCKITEGMAKNYKENKIPLPDSVMADLGDASVWIDALGKSLSEGATKEVTNAFGNLASVTGTSSRSKGTLSILKKLERDLIKKKEYANMESAIFQIIDLEGSRVFVKSLDNLSAKDVKNMIAEMKYEGKSLTVKQKELLRRYIYEENIKPKDQQEAFNLFYSFVEPLVQKRSQEVVDTLTLGILKHRIINEGLDVAKLKDSELFSKNLIEKLMTDKNIQPLNITEINNYKGNLGIPEFTNAQIQQLHIAMNSGKVKNEYLTVISDSRGLNRFNYSNEELQKLNEEAIKKSGYRTAQVNIEHSNGALGEIQFRGSITNDWAECEHIAYDLRQGKNTLGEIYNEYADAIQKLNKSEYQKYNEYLQKWYNYCNRLELGLPAKKPTLPTRFNPVLSAENMKKLHDLDFKIQKQANKGFVPYLHQVA